MGEANEGQAQESRRLPADYEPEMAAELIGVDTHTLANWRWQGKGPRFVRYGRQTIRYHKTDLVEFAESDVAVDDPAATLSDAALARQIARLATRLARRHLRNSNG
jgi:helix-turn-helix protein